MEVVHTPKKYLDKTTGNNQFFNPKCLPSAKTSQGYERKIIKKTNSPNETSTCKAL